jgi:hypothetical protein
MQQRLKLNINLDKIDAERIYHGEKGRWLDLTLRVDPDAELCPKFGNHGFVAHTQTKQEREASAAGQKAYAPIVGNFTITWQEGRERLNVTEAKKEKPVQKKDATDWIKDYKVSPDELEQAEEQDFKDDAIPF